MSRTRRSKSWSPLSEKNLVDNPPSKSVEYNPRGERSSDKANSEGIRIDEDLWAEFITVGKFLCLTEEDPDLYDLFDWIRINLNSGQPYGSGLLARVDSEIEKELGPWDMN